MAVRAYSGSNSDPQGKRSVDCYYEPKLLTTNQCGFARTYWEWHGLTTLYVYVQLDRFYIYRFTRIDSNLYIDYKDSSKDYYVKRVRLIQGQKNTFFSIPKMILSIMCRSLELGIVKYSTVLDILAIISNPYT